MLSLEIVQLSTIGNSFQISWDQTMSSTKIDLYRVIQAHSHHQLVVVSTEQNQAFFISKHGNVGLPLSTLILLQTIVKMAVLTIFTKTVPH
jgi:hypothetical protein